jgi:predicted ATPase
LLDEREQRLFRCLSIFVGGCSLEAAETVWTALGGSAEQVMDGVASLIDMSLLQQTAQEEGEPRFAMLETIREFGLVVLTASGERKTVEAAHAAYFLHIGEEADMWLWGPHLFTWLERLEREHDNLRAALTWGLSPARDEESVERL